MACIYVGHILVSRTKHACAENTFVELETVLLTNRL
jgi:hypothetical protein